MCRAWILWRSSMHKASWEAWLEARLGAPSMALGTIRGMVRCAPLLDFELSEGHLQLQGPDSLHSLINVMACTLGLQVWLEM